MPAAVGPSGDMHDNVVRYVARNRFPFPDQTDWPPNYVTITNETERRRSIDLGHAIYYPDIVVVDSNTGRIVEIGEVEVETGAQFVDKWRVFAEHSRQHPTSGARHFFVYVPEGLEAETQRLLEDGGVPFGGLRAYEATPDGAVRVVPVVTPVNPKDHR